MKLPIAVVILCVVLLGTVIYQADRICDLHTQLTKAKVDLVLAKNPRDWDTGK